jgi:hypothetical protein
MGLGVSWRALGASVAGAGHRARGTGCEDAAAFDVGPPLLLAVADGAGSAPCAARGSSAAVAVALAALRAGATVGDALLCAREALEDLAVADGVALGDLATTLLVARVDEGVVETAQVGDGAVVLRRDGAYEVPAPDAKGEYLNETCFLTSSSWRASMRSASVSAEDVDGVAAMTDGLQLVAFELATGTPHPPFFEPFLSFVRDDGPVEQLEAFLGSERVAARTDDDVTLVVASLV